MSNIMDGLSEQGYITLPVRTLVESEMERGTETGLKLKAKGGDCFSDEHLVVEVLKRIIYSGIEGHNKFLLEGFPVKIEQANALE